MDILILTRYPTYPNVIVPVKPIGLLEMIDSSENDNKIIAIPYNDPYFNEINEINDIQKSILDEIKNFFETYKKLQKKEVTVKEILGKEEAYKTILESMEAYNRAMKNKE